MYKKAWLELTDLIIILESSNIEIIATPFLLRLMSLLITKHGAQEPNDESTRPT